MQTYFFSSENGGGSRVFIFFIFFSPILDRPKISSEKKNKFEIRGHLTSDTWGQNRGWKI